MPRPKKDGIYSDGTYLWAWDQGEWLIFSPAPYGMPSYPNRAGLRYVHMHFEMTTDEDFE